MSVSKNQELELRIEALTNEGSGVGHYDGQAIFVPYTAPGDLARVRIVKATPRYAYGLLLHIITPGPGRADNDCPAFPACGGCQLRHLQYAEELQAKQGFVADAMARLGKVNCPVLTIMPAPSPFHYRNKAIFPIGRVNGKATPGFYASHSHRLVPCTSCRLQPVLLNQVAILFCAFLDQYTISIYDEESHSGLVRSLYLRYGEASGELMVCIIINGDTLPFADVLCQQLKEQYPQTATVLLCHNKHATNVVLGDQYTTLMGPGYINDTLCSMPLRLTAPSFYQVNHQGAQQLYQVAARFADLQGDEVLLDLYCGAGTIGLSMAAQCCQLIGVEIVPSAIEMARQNAAAMGISVPEKARFICADAGEAAAALAADGLRPDVVVVDPPRKGCDTPTLDAIIQMNPKRVVMVSCNPATAARDTAYLQANGYVATKIQPVDMFPRTKHVECVVLLSRVQK